MNAATHSAAATVAALVRGGDDGHRIRLGGGRFVSIPPRPDEFDLGEITRGLAKCCRYAGQLPGDTFYSVAETAVRCALAAPIRSRWNLLGHDNAEGYLGDPTRELKALLHDYERVESLFEKALARRYDIDFDDPAIKPIDHAAAATEIRDLYGEPVRLVDLPDPWPETIRPWSMREARLRFLRACIAYAPRREIRDEAEAALRTAFAERSISRRPADSARWTSPRR